MLTSDKIIEIFVKVDDFCKEFEIEIVKHQLEAGNYKVRNRKASLAESEIITILITFHSGYFTNLKHFYLGYICSYYKDYFPGLVSYNRFVELQQRVAVPMMLFLKTKCLGQSCRINFVDSTHIKVCHNRRIHNHKVFASVAERGQCSSGWFYGFKVQLIINDKGEILSFYLTKGKVDDRNVKLMASMTEQIFGKLFGDKGYLSKALADLLWGNGIQMITKPRKNMKGFNISQADRIMLRKRAIIECVNDELKNICKLQHIAVSVLNPLVVRRFCQMRMSRAKTDKKDAMMIAEYGKTERPGLWQIPEQHVITLQQMEALPANLNKERTALNNQLESFAPIAVCWKSSLKGRLLKNWGIRTDC